MRFAVLAAVLLAPGLAAAQDFESEPADLVFSGRQTTLDQYFEFPLTFNIGAVVQDIGVVGWLDNDSELFVRMEGESNVGWSANGTPGELQHQITPLPAGSEAAMTAAAGVGVDFVLDVDLIFADPGPITFSLLAQDITFQPRIDDFQPFLLPGQNPASLRVEADPVAGQFVIPFDINILDVGVFAASLGIEVTGTPAAFSDVTGLSLETYHDGDTYQVTDPTQPTPIQIYENDGELELETLYELQSSTSIGYNINVSGGLTLNILGADVPITANLLSQYIGFPAAIEQPEYSSDLYTHPLPKISTTIPTIDFGAVDAGNTQTFTFPVDNDGLLGLEGLVTLEGDTVFSASPGQVFAVGGGQDAVILTFAPDSEGEFLGDLVIASNDPLEPEIIVPVRGDGVVGSGNGDGTGGNDDNATDLYGTGQSTLYSACGCASPASTPAGWLPLVGLGLAFGFRRRRES